MQTSNEFYKGEDKDSDVLRIQKDRARDIHNMRIIDIDGKGLVATNIAGNKFVFNLSPGFIPMGSNQYNGVAYIVSFNKQTLETEIGCYPSPNSIISNNPLLTGFTKVYSPLNNFTGVNNARDPLSIGMAFRTSLFDSDCNHQFEVIVREDYDASINLYLVDNKKPIRVINSGFNNVDGTWTSFSRRYWNGSFPNAVNLLHESSKKLNYTFQGLGPNGILKAGNWFIFFRYATENFDRTSFNSETNAIQITDGDYIVDGFTHHGRSGGTATNKSIKLQLTNLDPAYSFIEVGFMYSFNEALEFGIIDKLFKIDPMVSSMDIEITGNESQFTLDISEFIKIKSKFDGAKTHTQLENIYFASNVFDTTNYDSENSKELLEFSRKVTCRFDSTKTLPHRNTTQALGIYNNEFNLHNFTGHFRGESYPYAMVFVLANGRETEAFPITASDDYNGLGGPTNDKGIYRFPNLSISHTVTGFNINVMGIKFDITAALIAIPPFILSSVEGFYIVRGERNPNLLYQGLNLPCYSSSKGQDIRNGFFYTLTDKPEILKQNVNYVPMFEYQPTKAYFPMKLRWDDSNAFNNEFTFVFQSDVLAAREPQKYGFYSPDHLFNKSLQQHKGWVEIYGIETFSVATNSESSKPDYFYNLQSIFYGNTSLGYLDMSNIKEWEVANNNGFTSYFPEGTKSDFNSFLYFYTQNFVGTKYCEVANLAMAFNSYIGLTSIQNIEYTLANIYKTDPKRSSGYMIEDLYDLKSTQYYKISQFFKLSDVIANPGLVNNPVFYKGDCFLQRTYIKQMFNPIYGTGVTDDGGDTSGSLFSFLSALNPFTTSGKRLFTFGVEFDLITENMVNSEMRLDNFVNKCFPASSPNVYDIAVKNNQKESIELNRGYNRVLSVRSHRGIDLDIPFFASRKPTAVIHSNKHLLSSFEDGYRLIDIAAIREYDYRLGNSLKITGNNGFLVLIQDNGISKLFVNERAVLQGTGSTGELVIGNGEVLSPKTQTISDVVGSQHQWSIVETDYSVYGYDYEKRKFWAIVGDQFDIITDSKLYRSESDKLASRYLGRDSDITNQMPDNPICIAGIVGGYDRRFGDIVWTFVYGRPSNDGSINCCTFNHDAEVVSYNELIQAFTGTRGHYSPFYISINEDFFSFNPRIFQSTMPSLPSLNGDCWIHDEALTTAGDNYTVFYGEPDADECSITVVVNEAADFTKVFDTLDLNTNGIPLLRIEYTDDQQLTNYTFLVPGAGNNWRNPVYDENLWRVPIIREQTAIVGDNNFNNVDSRLRDKYLVIKLVWKSKKRVYIKSVLTNFRPSKQ